MNRSTKRQRIAEGVDVAIAEGREVVVGEEREVDIVVRVHFEASAANAENAATAVTVGRNAANAVDTLVPVRMSSLYFLRNCWRSCCRTFHQPCCLRYLRRYAHSPYHR